MSTIKELDAVAQERFKKFCSHSTLLMGAHSTLLMGAHSTGHRESGHFDFWLRYPLSCRALWQTAQ